MVEITTDVDWFCPDVQNSGLDPADMAYSVYMRREKFHKKRFVRAANECYKYIGDVKCVELYGVITTEDMLRELHAIDAIVCVVHRTAIPDIITDFSTLWLIDNNNNAILFNRNVFAKCISMLIHYECQEPLHKIIKKVYK